MADDLTDADRDYARRWAAARGKRPLHERGRHRWHSEALSGVHPDALPGVVYCALELHPHALFASESEAEAWDAMALALRRLRAAAAIPGEG